MIADVLSIGLAILIFSVTDVFLEQYFSLLSRVGEAGAAAILENNPMLKYANYLALIFPALVVAVFVVYIVLTITSHKFGKYSVTKLTAQRCYDIYAFCVSLCKLPALLGIFDAAYIFHNNMLGVKVSPFSLQILLDAIIIAIIIRYGHHRIIRLTSKQTEDNIKEEPAIKVKAVPAEKTDVDITPEEENQ